MKSNLIKTISIPSNQRKKTTIARNLFYDVLEVYDNKIIGTGNQDITWYFKDYSGIDFIKASLNSQFAQIVFLTGINSKNRALGPDLFATQNANAMNDTNRILFCSGMFSFNNTNSFAKAIADEIIAAFNNYKERENEFDHDQGGTISGADEIKKFKALLDDGIITQEEFNAKKKQLLGL